MKKWKTKKEKSSSEVGANDKDGGGKGANIRKC